jgi:hypothetical protein
MKAFLQWASLLLAVGALGISALTYLKVQNLRSGDQAAAEAVEKLRQDIATYVAQKRVATTQEAQAMQQGLQQDLKKFQEVSKDYLKPPSDDYLENIFSSPSPSPTGQK